MKDHKLLNDLWKEVEAGRVTSSTTNDLTLFKYTQETHIKDLWNDANRQARGIIFRADGTIVARPFSKFFNLDERPETEAKNLPWSEGVEVYEKLDGSCGTGYFIEGRGDWKLATPGSMESDQAIEGTRMLNEFIQVPADPLVVPDDWICHLPDKSVKRYDTEYLPKDCTPVFEIIYPDNRIVVDYRGERKLVLLSIFEHNGEEWHPRRVDQMAELCGFPRPKRYDIDLRCDISFEDNHEGYVCRFGNGFRVKVKSPTYLRIHRILNHMSPKGVIDLIRGKEYGVTISQLPKEIAKNFDDIHAHVQGIHNRIVTRAYENLITMQNELSIKANRKEYAQWVTNNVLNSECGFVFALLDGKDIEEKVWRLVLKTVSDNVTTLD